MKPLKFYANVQLIFVFHFPGKTSFILPKMPIKSSGPVVPMRKHTPARTKFNGVNKENSAKVKAKINPKYLCATPVRPKSALASRQVNVENSKTPETKGRIYLLFF